MNTLVRENRTNGERQTTEQFIAPAATVLENTDGYTLEVEMPGVTKENLEMWVENNELTILGRRSMPIRRRHASPSGIAFGKLPALVRARSVDRRGQNQREDRARRRDFDSAQGGASQAAQDRRSVNKFVWLIGAGRKP